LKRITTRSTESEMKLTCPNDTEHKVFVVTALVPETWILNEDGDCEDAFELRGGHIEYDFNDARCEECDATVVLEEE
jgi:hypothetical protein